MDACGKGADEANGDAILQMLASSLPNTGSLQYMALDTDLTTRLVNESTSDYVPLQDATTATFTSPAQD